MYRTKTSHGGSMGAHSLVLFEDEPIAHLYEDCNTYEDFERLLRFIDGQWFHMSEAPQDHEIEVFCPGKDGLPPMMITVRWHPDAGFTVDEFREPTMWREIL